MSSHDDPLQELIDAAEAIVPPAKASSRGHYVTVPYTYIHRIDEALAPFRPDPEEGMIEAILEEMSRISLTSNEGYATRMARAALAVIKEKGYFNDQR